MTLPASGAITFNDINVEIGVAGTTALGIADRYPAEVTNGLHCRAMANIPHPDAISMADLYGKIDRPWNYDLSGLTGPRYWIQSVEGFGDKYYAVYWDELSPICKIYDTDNYRIVSHYDDEVEGYRYYRGNLRATDGENYWKYEICRYGMVF
jgi:hypothetical protein